MKICLLILVVMGFAKAAYYKLNCYTETNDGTYYGATDVLPSIRFLLLTRGEAIEECTKACLNKVGCTGIIWGNWNNVCHLKKNISLGSCKNSDHHTLITM